MGTDESTFKDMYQLNPKINETGKICIFGTGINAVYAFEELRKKEINIDFFADKRPQCEYKRQFLSLPVFDEDQLIGVDCSVIIASSFWKEIAERLMNKNITNLFIAPVITGKKISIIKDGKFLLSIGDIILRKDIIYICCPCGLGDTLYVAALAKEYKNVYPEVKKVCLIIKENHLNIVLLFRGVDEVIISDRIVAALHDYSVSTETWRQNNYIYGHFNSDWMKKYIFGNYNGNMVSSYKKYVMRLPESCELEYPQFPKKPNSMPQINKNTIILMPYAVSSEMLPESFWVNIAKVLICSGYRVYTNIKDNSERIVSGTEGLSETVDVMAQLCERCFAVISVRSGICDVLGFTKTTLLVINMEKSHSEFWNIKSDINNYIYNLNFYDHKCINRLENDIMQILDKIGA